MCFLKRLRIVYFVVKEVLRVLFEIFIFVVFRSWFWVGWGSGFVLGFIGFFWCLVLGGFFLWMGRILCCICGLCFWGLVLEVGFLLGISGGGYGFESGWDFYFFVVFGGFFFGLVLE